MRNLPNIISTLRLAMMPVLFWLAYTGADQSFAWLLVVAGATDFLDGWLARKYGWVSRLGAMLDSAADISIVVVVLYAVSSLRPEVFVADGEVVWAVILIWSVANLAGLIRYRRLPSFHTGFARFGLMMFGGFVLVLFFYGFLPWLLLLCGGICFLAGVESLVLVFLLDRWTPNLRGGLLAVWRDRSATKNGKA